MTWYEDLYDWVDSAPRGAVRSLQVGVAYAKDRSGERRNNYAAAGRAELRPAPGRLEWLMAKPGRSPHGGRARAGVRPRCDTDSDLRRRRLGLLLESRAHPC